MIKIPLYQPTVDNEEEEAVIRVLRSKKLSKGSEIEQFENELSSFLGKKYVIAVNSGTSALHLAVKSLGWKKGDEVITTAYSFIASSNALLYEEITPIFVDIDPQTLNLNLNSVTNKITERTVGILPVHMWGFPADAKKMLELKNKYKLTILEDASQAIGKPSNLFPITQAGEITVYSFSENKQMTTGGEGGAIVTNDSNIAEFCRSLRDQGRSFEENWLDHVRLGYNYKITELQAAIGRVQLKKLPRFLEKRENLARKYTEYLKNVSGLTTPFESRNYKRSWFLYYLTFESLDLRKKVQKHLENKGIESRIFFPPIPSYHEFRRRGYNIGNYPIANGIYEKTLALPLFPNMREEEVIFICNEIRKALK